METRNPETRPTVVAHEVLSAISHELRGPLGVARGYLQMLAQGQALDARGAKMVADIQRAANRMSGLLDEVSELARWVRGEHTVNGTLGPLADLVAAAAARATFPDSPLVRVEVAAPADVTAVVDQPPLVRAWAALISAVARAQVEDATIAVVLRRSEAGPAELRIAPQTRLDAADERPMTIERAGAGLSLALAELILQRHGGGVVECWQPGAWAGYRCWL